MIKISINESKTLEGIKMGMKVSQIANMYGLGETTVRGHIRYLLRKNLVSSGKVDRKSSCYAYNGTSYVVDTVTKYNRKIQLTHDHGEDKLLKRAMNIQLTDEQLFYLQQHKDKPRTRLAKRLGLTKLQLIFALERMKSA